MKTMGVGLMLVSLLTLAGQAAGWEITVTGPVTIRGEGPLPTLTVPPPAAPITVVPPPIPPTVVPPPPARDERPFVFPTNCASRPVDAAERTIWSWAYPGDFQTFYAYLDGTGNPSILSHTCAGIFAPSAMTPPQPPMLPNGKSLKDAKLWVPRSAGEKRPWDIRCVLETGRICPR